MTATEAANLTELMQDVVVEGTGSSVRTDASTVAAKTGTAEFETGKRDTRLVYRFCSGTVTENRCYSPGGRIRQRWKNCGGLLQGSCLIYI